MNDRKIRDMRSTIHGRIVSQACSVPTITEQRLTRFCNKGLAMFVIVTLTLGFVCIGGFAANALLISCLVGCVLSGQGSHVSKERRLPEDSDAMLFRRLFVIGGGIGLAFAYAGGFREWLYAFPNGIAAFAVGSIISYRLCVQLNDSYLSRAQTNLDLGDFRGAIEDAKEVARSSESLRPLANAIVAQAQEMRMQQPSSAGEAMWATPETTGLETASLISS